MLYPFIIIIVIILLFFFTPPLKVKEKSNKLLSFETSTILRGLAILLVIFQHIGGGFGTNLLTPLGGTGVAIFLVLSGYGLNESFKKKGIDYYWRNRISRVFIPYFILISIILCFSDSFNIKTYLLDIFGIRTSYWYIAFLLKQYILYYIATRFLYKYRLQIIFIISIIFIFILPNIEAEQGLSFFVGVLISEKYNKLCLNKSLTKSVIIFSFFCIGSIFLAIKQLPIIREYEDHFIWHWVQLFIKLPYAIFFILIIHKFSIFRRKFLTFTGMISYELYLVHMIFLKYIDMELMNALMILVISFALSYLFYLLNQHTNVFLKKKISINF